MPDMTLIAGTVASLKAASDLAKGLVGIRDATMINDKVIELQRVILAAQSDAFAAQSELFSMAEKIRELEKQVAEVYAWQAEARRYKLTHLPPGAYVYILTAEAANGEPTHYICATCYEAGKKAILQSKGAIQGIETLHCNRCGSEVRHGTRTPLQRRAISSAVW